MSFRSLLLLAVACTAAPAGAETLAEAIAAAYQSNPDLDAQRAAVRIADEGVPQALAAGRPTIGTQVSFNQAGLEFRDNGRTYTSGLQISQSLFQGGRVRSSTSAAEARILASRARLRASENSIVLNVVTAYADVLRFERVVGLNDSQVKVLDRELQASKDRFEVGDVTRTDVAQSQARLANAQSNRVLAENQLAAARQAFRRVVGHAPETLDPLPPLPLLPGTAGQATDIARSNNPQLIAARFDEEAARFDVKTVQKARLPSVNATVGAAYQYFQGGGAGTSFIRQGGFFTQSANVVATIPLYQAGLIGSQVREAQQRQSQLLEIIGSVSRQTDESATNSFNQLRAARAVIDASKVALDANALAAEGVRQENQVGSRTVIEVLNAEQELLNSQVNLVTAQRDEQVAAFALLASVGAAEAVALGVPVDRYDATQNAALVRRRIFDGSTELPAAPPPPPPQSASQSQIIGPPQP
jgi:outer membrane protein